MGVTSIMPPAPTAAQLVRPKHEGNCRFGANVRQDTFSLTVRPFPSGKASAEASGGWRELAHWIFRERVVAAVADGQPCRAVALSLRVSVASVVVKWSQRARAAGSPAA
jgi:hypothetical protein